MWLLDNALPIGWLGRRGLYAGDHNFPSEDGGCVYPMILFNLKVFMLWFVTENIPGNFGFARY